MKMMKNYFLLKRLISKFVNNKEEKKFRLFVLGKKIIGLYGLMSYRIIDLQHCPYSIDHVLAAC